MWLKITNQVDKLINNINMYRLLLYYLIAILLAAIGLSFTGNLQYKPLLIAASALICVSACWIINKILAYYFDAPTNPESSILTGLILSLIIPPTFDNFGILFMLAASGLAMGSKYLLAINHKHIFNPAAIAVVLTAVGPHQNASWWVGTSVLLPIVIIGGILVARKTRRGFMVISFLISTTIVTSVLSVFGKASIYTNLHDMVFASAALFIGFVMLTEPYSSPSTRNKQIIYASLVGFLIAPQIHIFHYYTSPEIALIVGNIFAYIVSPKVKLFPILKEKIKIAANTVEFAFNPGKKIAYLPGQYMEFTLPHTDTDNRGARRYFTLASSPTEDELLLGIKFYPKSSSFKAALLDINADSQIVAGQLGGDFVMPKNNNEKLAFIAGGIGITPFRSMLKYLIDKNEHRDISMIYGAQTQNDVAYRDVIEQARNSLGVNTLYLFSDKSSSITWPNSAPGFVNAEVIKQRIPDYKDRTFYISGTHQMVEAVEEELRKIDVHYSKIKTDFFPGYA